VLSRLQNKVVAANGEAVAPPVVFRHNTQVATAAELAQPMIRDRTIRIADMIDGESVIRGKVIRNCVLEGPAVMATPQGQGNRI
jgi:hypothetical protein